MVKPQFGQTRKLHAAVGPGGWGGPWEATGMTLCPPRLVAPSVHIPEMTTSVPGAHRDPTYQALG